MFNMAQFNTVVARIGMRVFIVVIQYIFIATVRIIDTSGTKYLQPGMFKQVTWL
jgi:hypothetical protein